MTPAFFIQAHASSEGKAFCGEKDKKLRLPFPCSRRTAGLEIKERPFKPTAHIIYCTARNTTVVNVAPKHRRKRTLERKQQGYGANITRLPLPDRRTCKGRTSIQATVPNGTPCLRSPFPASRTPLKMRIIASVFSRHTEKGSGIPRCQNLLVFFFSNIPVRSRVNSRRRKIRLRRRRSRLHHRKNCRRRSLHRRHKTNRPEKTNAVCVW